MQLFAIQIELVSQRVRDIWCCTELQQKARHTSQKKKEYVEVNRSFTLGTKGLQARVYVRQSCMLLSNREAPHHSLSSDTNLASATLWLLLKLACHPGEPLPVNIKSWHNSVQHTQHDMGKITCEMRVRGSSDFNCCKSLVWPFLNRWCKR